MCLLLCPPRAAAQPTVDLAGVRCARPGEFVVVLSDIEPTDDIESARVFFRSSLYPDFYYVEMTHEEGGYVGVLPQPAEDTPEVVYYVEAVDRAFSTTTSREFHASVAKRCRQDPAALAYLAGGTPGITVGGTVAGVAAIPPGFAASGIVSTITAAGAAAGVGGGISAGTAVAVGAAAAGAAGAAVATTGGTDDPTSSTSTSTAVAVSPTTSSSTTTVAGGGSSTTTSTTAGPTTTTTSGTTTSLPGPSTTTSPTTSVPSSTTTSAPASTTTSVGGGALDASCFTVVPLGPCKVRADASCVALPVDRYEWTFDLNNRWKKVQFPNAPAVKTYTWNSAKCGSDAMLRFKLKVRRGGETSTIEKNFFITGDELKAPATSRTRVRFESELALEGASVRGRVLLNGMLLRVVQSGQPVELRGRALLGKNTLTAFVTQPATAKGMWRFDFSGEPKLVPGSLRVRSGHLLSLEPTAVVLEPGSRIELAFELRQ